MPTSIEPFWGAVHSSLQEQLQLVSPYLWSSLPILERIGRVCCYLRLTRLLRASPNSPATEGAVVAGCTLMAGSFFPSLERGVKAVLAAQCAQNLFSQCLALQQAAHRVILLIVERYPSPTPRLPFEASLFSPACILPVRKKWQKTALFISLVCQAIWQTIRALFSCALLLGEISLVMQGETAIQFTLLSALASPNRRVDEETEDTLDSSAIEQESEPGLGINWMECIRIKCGLAEERNSSPHLSPSQIVGDSWRDLKRAAWSPGKITPFSLQLSPSLSSTQKMGRFPPVWQEERMESSVKSPSHTQAKRSLLGLFSTFCLKK